MSGYSRRPVIELPMIPSHNRPVTMEGSDGKSNPSTIKNAALKRANFGHKRTFRLTNN
jgi:hypothetical protein